MSRYRPDPRYSEGNLPYREPPAQRWDTDRFAREREIRAPPVIDQRPPYADFPPRRAPVYEDQRYYEEDRYGPRGTTQRKYFEETDYYDPRGQRGQMVPYAPERPARPEPPPRPGLLRRQSSLDTFDRQPARRYRDYDDDYVPQRAPPPRELIPVPVPSPRRQPRYDDRYYDDVRVQDPDLYGDDGFREYREREWVSRRRRNSSPSPDRRTMREEFFEEVKEEKEVKQYPRRGKTRMPKRLVHTKVLYDLGYPYYEEDERTIIIEKALGPENIDEIFAKSKEYREREVSTTRLIEAPPRSSRHGDFVIEKSEKVEEIKTVPLTQAPRSVREWDALSVRSPSPKSHRSRSRRRRSSPGLVKETVVEKKEVVKEVSPARTHRSSTTRRRGSSVSDETIIERKIVREDEFEDSNSVHVGPLALVVDRKPQRSERDIKEEIRSLEAERKALRRERRYERDPGTEIVKVERVRERSPSPRGEVIIERRGDEILEVKKDRRGRSRSVAAPSPAIIKAMMATLT
ncbi:hypothetical protein ABEF95_005783 [Exophiala dermatitidis]|uniref:DUF8035 domain-containing protein n=2 Tax=Exophiala dermatitidis TaxID=5970 RepID=H6C7Q0_EXODN|nr:uncharacterized protein HMPREF1120_06882 [Exophiala dermatitidis NIH/UT8656]KAJ4546120.1 hypothetical protein HRR77_004659 [Exophiala dermatitidis]EHY58880.1 hypothetical protein HMPREF1120_06882 [Exophiala dermatitidis NIH/UT8656]KAJ4624299.1 hypothetical protein HRR86_005562 [Exophiala dermatitidis]KAJ4676131.1 hypothetical protein HRR93_004030 [Exophiala dermatitidis]KAJ8995177.1 hypothetical protein HRR80_001866 [Exophiala dermatitidis]